MSFRADFKYVALMFGGVGCVLFAAIACALIFVWHGYRTEYGWVLADSGDEKVTRKARIVVREFLDPVLPDEDGIYRLEYWQGNIMRECVSFASDSVRADGARLQWEPDGSCSVWLHYWGKESNIGTWHGSWKHPQ